MANALQWTGNTAFAEKKAVEWTVDDHAAGLVRAHDNFTFATVYGAGHMVSSPRS